MDRFIRCLCEDDYSALIQSGTATKEELHNQWILFLSDYYEMRGDTVTTTEHMRIKRDAIRLQNHLFAVNKCIWFLQNRYSTSIAESLRKMGYKFNPETFEPDNYRDQLQVISNKSKSKLIQLQQLLKELEKVINNISDEKPTREQFEKVLIEVEAMQKVSYTIESITVAKYLMLEKKLIAYSESLKAQRA